MPLSQASPSIWAYLFWLILSFVVLLGLNRWIVAHIQGLGYLLSQNKLAATWLYFFVFFPGILLHELSHYVMALLLQVKATKFSVWPQEQSRGQVVMGSVEVRGAGPLRHSLIGVAPLLTGTVAVFWLSRWLKLDGVGQSLIAGNVDAFISALGTSLLTPDFWLWVYLLFVIANTMLPSPADRLYWLPVLLFLGVGSALVIGLDLLPNLPTLIDNVEDNLPPILAYLTSAFLTAVLVNVFFIILISLSENLIGATTGRRVQY